MTTLLQIVPRIPGGLDGVGDYALTIARRLQQEFGCATTFATFRASSPAKTDGFDVLPLENVARESDKFDHVLLHYVNYGFQKRGVPFRLLSILRSLRDRHRARLLTIFHELYASGPPWTSAFWLRPLQVDLAKQVARLSDAGVVSSDNSRRELRRICPHLEIAWHPIPSGFGEPSLSVEQIRQRDPHRWTVFGGTGLIQRSLRAFRKMMSRIPSSIAPQSLFVLGGEDNPTTRSLLGEIGFEFEYRPSIAARDASEILKTCSFAFFDYFHRPDVETSVILKSSAFASACAHGIIPVLPHPGSSIIIDGNRFPGPFFVAKDGAEIPNAEARAEIANQVYAWYQRHVSSQHLIQTIAHMIGLSAPQ